MCVGGGGAGVKPKSLAFGWILMENTIHQCPFMNFEIIFFIKSALIEKNLSHISNQHANEPNENQHETQNHFLKQYLFTIVDVSLLRRVFFFSLFAIHIFIQVQFAICCINFFRLLCFSANSSFSDCCCNFP